MNYLKWSEIYQIIKIDTIKGNSLIYNYETAEGSLGLF